jgi:histidinol-phosphate phosphatase family protein
MKVTMIMGAPASGKSTLAKEALTTDSVHLNRDTEGGKVMHLLPKMEVALKSGKDVVVDNLFTIAETRKPFIDLAKKYKAEMIGRLMGTSLEDSQINALHRMYKKHGQIFFDAQQMKHIKDPGTFPVAVLFVYRKNFEKPLLTEGFDELTKIKFVRKPSTYSNKAVIFDYDGTLRESTGEYQYPVKIDDVKLMPGRAEKINDCLANGYSVIGVSNQSGIGKGVLTDEDAIRCFDHTHDELGINFEYLYCPHKVPPITCYCRKPQAGLGVHFIEKYKLKPSDCIVVGDMTTDRTFASRLNMQFEWAKDFFK